MGIIPPIPPITPLPPYRLPTHNDEASIRDIVTCLIFVALFFWVLFTLLAWLMDVSTNEEGASLLHTLKWQLEFIKKLKIK